MPTNNKYLVSKKIKNKCLFIGMDLNEIIEGLDKHDGSFKKIQYLQSRIELCGIEKGMEYYAKHENHPCPKLWDAILSARFGVENKSKDKFKSEQDLDLYQLGYDQWDIYCRVKQMIADIEAGKPIEKKESKLTMQQLAFIAIYNGKVIYSEDQAKKYLNDVGSNHKTYGKFLGDYYRPFNENGIDSIIKFNLADKRNFTERIKNLNTIIPYLDGNAKEKALEHLNELKKKRI